MSPFEPAGDLPKWRLIYDHAEQLQPGDLINWATLTELLGYDPSTPGAARSPITTASKHLLIDHSRTLTAVRGKGYRIARADEHETIAKGGQRSARRKLSGALGVAIHVNRNELSEPQRRSLDAFAHVLAQQNAMLKRHDAKIKDIETVAQQQDARLDVLEDVLRKAGIPIPERTIIEGETT